MLSARSHSVYLSNREEYKDCSVPEYHSYIDVSWSMSSAQSSNNSASWCSGCFEHFCKTRRKTLTCWVLEIWSFKEMGLLIKVWLFHLQAEDNFNLQEGRPWQDLYHWLSSILLLLLWLQTLLSSRYINCIGVFGLRLRCRVCQVQPYASEWKLCYETNEPKLLGEILLNRSNFNVMMKYISSRNNLKIMMCLLCDLSGNIQFEAFHVFKMFVTARISILRLQKFWRRIRWNLWRISIIKIKKAATSSFETKKTC